MNEYYCGNIITCSASFIGTSGSAADPGSVVFTFVTPSGSMGTYAYAGTVESELKKDSTGHYHVDLAVSVPGVWRIKFAGLVSDICAAESSFYCRESEFD